MSNMEKINLEDALGWLGDIEEQLDELAADISNLEDTKVRLSYKLEMLKKTIGELKKRSRYEYKAVRSKNTQIVRGLLFDTC